MKEFSQYSYLKMKVEGVSAPSFEGFFIRCLFVGGFRSKYKSFAADLSSGVYLKPSFARLRVVVGLQRFYSARLSGGVAWKSINCELESVASFIRFADANCFQFSQSSLPLIFQEWADHLYSEVSVNKLSGRRGHALIRDLIRGIADLVAEPWDLEKLAGLSRFDRNQANKRKLSVSEGVVLDYCADLLAIIEGFSIDNILQRPPIHIYFGSYGFWAAIRGGLKQPFDMKEFPKREPVGRDKLIERRSTYLNLRIQAELSYFIAQTGMNLSQASALTVGDYRFQTWKDGYEVRKYKARRKGEVIFTVYAGYLPHFKRYLEFRNEIQMDLDRDELFPLSVRNRNSNVVRSVLGTLKDVMSEIHRPYISPMKLRKSKSNWLLRRGVEPRVVADIMQHSVETLHRNYEEPDKLKAQLEWKSFFSLLERDEQPIAPGLCSKIPKKISAFDKALLVPDCKNVSACFFCESYSGVASFDYAWSLASYRYLKILESSKVKNIDSLPSVRQQYGILIHRLDEILVEFERFSPACSEFLGQVRQKVMLGQYHPRWELYIVLTIEN